MKHLLVYAYFLCVGMTFAQVGSENSLFPEGSKIPLDELWEMGKEYYFEEDYPNCIKALEKALVAYRMMKHVDIACNRKCKNTNITADLPHLEFYKYDDLLAVGNLVAEGNCIKLCIEEHPYGVSVQDRPSEQVVEAFQLRQPYDFLQFSYFKMNLIKQACQAVYTYHQVHLNDEPTINNINYYKTLENVTDADFTDLEASKFYRHFLAGTTAYGKQNYEAVIGNIEAALKEYYLEHEECELLCYKPHSHTYFHRFYHAVSDQFLNTLECQLSCRETLNPLVNGYIVENTLARCYAYLQFAYYQLGNIKMAAPCAASALLLHPDDVDAKNNMRFYTNAAPKYGLSTAVHLSPRHEAVEFQNHISALQKLLGDGRAAFDRKDEGDVPETSETGLTSDDIEGDILQQLDEKIMQKLEERLGKITA